MTEQRVPGPTPAGGDYGIVRYLDAHGQEATAAFAVTLELREYTRAGELITTTTAALHPPQDSSHA
jgi:hypothetical protein